MHALRAFATAEECFRRATISHHPESIQENTSMRISTPVLSSPVFKSRLAVLALSLVLPFATLAARAQGLSYDGPVGILATPLAYTLASPANGLGKPTVGFHILVGGPRVGNNSAFSVTEGLYKRFEFGYTSNVHSGSNTVNVVHPNGTETIYSPAAWKSGFSIVHAKANVIPENSFGSKLIPAVSVGGIYRFNDNIGPNLNSFTASTLHLTELEQKANNFDIYVVASKTITQISKKVPVLLTAGLRGTNFSLWGLGGNAPGFEGKVFGSAAFVLTGPGKSTIILGSEVSEQPQHILVASAPHAALFDIPTSEVYAVRFVPGPKSKLNVDAGIVHAGGWIGNKTTETLLGGNTNLDIRARLALAVGYAF
jgi:hypothetical protein